MVAVIIGLGLVNWLLTLLVAESVFFAPVRDFTFNRVAGAERRFTKWLWGRVDYFLTCPMCLGVWVALVQGLWAPALFGTGIIAWLFAALLIKAIGHAAYVYFKRVEEDAALSKIEAIEVRRRLRDK